MILVFMGDQDGVDGADILAKHLLAEIWSTVNYDVFVTRHH